jgi:hypothetical protein
LSEIDGKDSDNDRQRGPEGAEPRGRRPSDLEYIRAVSAKTNPRGFAPRVPKRGV